MASISTPPYFKAYQSAARKAAAGAGLEAPYFRPKVRADDDFVKTTTWRSQRLTLSMPDVAGRWTLYLAYAFQSLPGGSGDSLVSSSFGLEFEGDHLGKGSVVTVVRFDYSLLLDGADPEVPSEDEPSVAVHMNVLQEDPLGSHLHFPTFRSEPWEPDEIMRWLTSRRLHRDLKRRMPG
ncbi:MAG TPA: hypothetical protein VHU24_05405 [Solirubrobacterales bacterium]|jgi:hypothetical protein|nr:hypothetical protein [Solirubrobacterales bacterium]